MIAQVVVVFFVLLQVVTSFTALKNECASRICSLRMSKSDDLRVSLGRIATATSLAFGISASSAIAADYAPATPPPQIAPQIVRQTPKAVQAGVPEKWIYSKFLDEVEKDHVEKVTFSPDGKKAVGVDDDGDRFTVDIPNDPNLLSFLVQHKVEINVAPINANGGTGSDAAPLAIPESEVDRLIQTFGVPGVLTTGIFLYPSFKLLFPSKEEREKAKTKTRAPPRGPGLFGGGGPPGRGGARGPGGLDPEAFAKSKAKVDLTPVTNTNFADVAGCDSAKIELEEVVDFLKNPDRYTEMGAKIPRGCLVSSSSIRFRGLVASISVLTYSFL